MKAFAFERQVAAHWWRLSAADRDAVMDGRAQTVFRPLRPFARLVMPYTRRRMDRLAEQVAREHGWLWQ